MNKTIIHTIRDNTPSTKEDVEAFGKLLDKGYLVMQEFSYDDEYYYVMMKHEHEAEEEELRN